MHHEIIGRSRYGKSTYLENLILAAPGGFVFLDPHGQSAERIADILPDVIYWDAGDPECGITFNPLKDIPQGQHHLAAAQMVYALKAIWGETSWGPRLEYILKHSLRLVLDNNGSLLDIPKLLTDPTYRTTCLRPLRRKAVSGPDWRADRARLDFWEEEFDDWDTRYRNEAIAPVLNKIGEFSTNPILSRILRSSSINFLRMMNKGQRLVVSLAKGKLKLGDDPSHLLGALIVAGFYSAAQARPFNPPRFDLFIDEFQNFATHSFADILSEAGKFSLHLTLSHQFLAQAPKELLPAIFANVSTITAFRVSAEDADFLSREMDIAAESLTDLDRYRAWVKNGYRRRINTEPPALALGKLGANKANTRARYSGITNS